MLTGAGDERRATALKIAVALAVALYVLLIAKLIAGASGPAGFHVPLFALALVCAPAAVVVSLRAPVIFPLGFFIALLPFDPLLSVSAGASLVRFLGMASAIALIVRMLLTRNVLTLRKPWYAWLAFVLWAVISLLWTDYMAEGMRVAAIFVQNFGLLTILALYPLTRRDFKAIVAIMVVAGVGAVAYAFSSGGGMGAVARMSIMSASGNVVDQNFFATSFILPIAFAYTTATVTRNTLLRIAYWLAVGVMVVGVLVSGSRGAFLALGLMFGYFALRGRSWTQVAVLFAGFVALLLRFPLVWERFMHDDGGGTGSGRTLIWNVGLHALRGHWLFGTGLGSFQETYARVFLSAYQRSNQGWMRPAHNVPIGMSVEIGLIGFALLVIAWVVTFRSLRVIPRGSVNFAFRTACEGAILAFAVQSMFIDAMWVKYVWLGLTLPFVILNLEQPRAALARRVARFGFIPARTA